MTSRPGEHTKIIIISMPEDCLNEPEAGHLRNHCRQAFEVNCIKTRDTESWHQRPLLRKPLCGHISLGFTFPQRLTVASLLIHCPPEPAVPLLRHCRSSGGFSDGRLDWRGNCRSYAAGFQQAKDFHHCLYAGSCFSSQHHKKRNLVASFRCDAEAVRSACLKATIT